MPVILQRLTMALAASALFAVQAGHAETQGASSANTPVCPAVAAGPDDPGEVVRELYRIVSGPAGTPKDWARLRALHAPGAIITAPQHVGDRLHATTYNVEQFTALNEKLFGQRGFFEAELRQDVRTFGHVAHVWSAYSSGETAATPSSYGVNSFQLLNDGKRWCVISATWDGDAARHASIREWLAIPSPASP